MNTKKIVKIVSLICLFCYMGCAQLIQDPTGQPIVSTDKISENIGTLKIIEGGTFSNDMTYMTVSTFWISEHEITGEQYATVAGVNDPSYFLEVPDHPVERVSWYDAVEFCNDLSDLEDLSQVYTITNREPETGHPITSATVTANLNAPGYRLPTETEWEFAARGGNKSSGYNYSGSDNIEGVGWYMDNSNNSTSPIGRKLPNEQGLYDMTGNVMEWCWDFFGDYPGSPQTDYTGPDNGTYRVLRGGSFDSPDFFSGVFSRGYFEGAMETYYEFGFRVVRR